MKKGKALKRHLDRKHNERRVNILKAKLTRRGDTSWIPERWFKNAKGFLDMWYHRSFRDMSAKARSREEMRKMLRNFEEWEE